jgi:type II secretory pathway predicted ATPase ExeA
MSPSNAETLMEEVSLECELTILRRQQALVEEARELETEVLRTLYALYEKRSAEVERLRHLLVEKGEPSAAGIMAPLGTR